MGVECEVSAKRAAGEPMGFFERYLTLWVFLCILAGIGLGQLFNAPFRFLGSLEVAQVNLPVAILIWLMVIPMLIKVDFGALHHLRAAPLDDCERIRTSSHAPSIEVFECTSEVSDFDV